MCWAGEPGYEGEAGMTTEEIISNMARLSLTGKLSLAISEYRSLGQWCFVFVPYYGLNPELKKEELAHQIKVQSVGDQHELLLERELSILLKMFQETRLI